MSEKPFDNHILETLPVDYSVEDYWHLLKKATAFQINKDVSVVYRGEGRWAVLTPNRFVLNCNGKPEYEPFPSQRSEEFTRDTSFTFGAAFNMAHAYIARLEREDMERKAKRKSANE